MRTNFERLVVCLIVLMALSAIGGIVFLDYTRPTDAPLAGDKIIALVSPPISGLIALLAIYARRGKE